MTISFYHHFTILLFYFILMKVKFSVVSNQLFFVGLQSSSGINRSGRTSSLHHPSRWRPRGEFTKSAHLLQPYWYPAVPHPGAHVWKTHPGCWGNLWIRSWIVCLFGLSVGPAMFDYNSHGISLVCQFLHRQASNRPEGRFTGWSGACYKPNVYAEFFFEI